LSDSWHGDEGSEAANRAQAADPADKG
jgi:hypothetical protein